MQDQFIQIYSNVIPHDVCDEIIDQFNKAEYMGFTNTRKKSEGESLMKTEKDDTHLFYPAELNLNALDFDLLKEFNEHYLWGIAYKQYAAKFDYLNKLPHHYSYVAKIQKTQPGQGYHTWHAEHSDKENSARIATWTAYLNDDFEAGETEFLYQQYRYKPNKGDIVIFPASYTHVHRGNPPIGGDKFIITGWFQY